MWPEPRPRQCPRRPRPTAGPVWCQKAIAKARNATRPRLATPRAIAPWRRNEARLRSSSNISICPPIVCTWSVALRLPHVIAHAALEFPHRGSPFPPEPYRTPAACTPQPHARWEAIRLNLTARYVVRSATRASRAKRNYGYWYSRGLAPRFSQMRRKTTHSCVSAPPSRPLIITVSMVSRKRAPYAGEAQGKSYCLR